MTNEEPSHPSASLRRSPFVFPYSILGRNRLLFFVVALVLYSAGRAPFIGQWDSFDYLKQIVTHRLSDLGFGRPVFIGFNILLWESLKRILGLSPLQAEDMAMVEMILVGAAGVLIFAVLARQILNPTAGRLATVALLLSPIYALYSGSVMTEVPMVVTLIAVAAVLWPMTHRHRLMRDIAGGVLFGLAVGMREQAVTMGAGYLWILWSRRSGMSLRVRSIAAFGAASAIVIGGPVAALYFYDPSAFVQRMQTWVHAIPTGQVHFWKNVQASLLYVFAVSPAAWLATLGAGINHWLRRRGKRIGTSGSLPGDQDKQVGIASIPLPIMGVVCCLILPIAALWRDADVQIHPRYDMVALPAALVLCASIYSKWAPSARGAVTWVTLHLAVFGIAQAGIQPFRDIQGEKREYARLARESIPGEALLVPGGYSPIMDYYRALGDRPQWLILWSGWGWEAKVAEAKIRDAWKRHIPVYLCEGPAGWLYFEDELLDLYFIFKASPKEAVAPGLLRIYPDYAR